MYDLYVKNVGMISMYRDGSYCPNDVHKKIRCNLCSKTLSRIELLCRYTNDKGILFCSNCYDRIDEWKKEIDNYEVMKI